MFIIACKRFLSNNFLIYLLKNEYFFCGNKAFHKVENCGKCSNKYNCDLCKNGYVFINDEKSICKSLKELGNQYFIDENDNKIYRKCSDFMQNCNTCST